MQKYVFEFEQSKILKYGLSSNEVFILDKIYKFIKSGCCHDTINLDGCKYYLLYNSKIISDLAFLDICERTLRRIIQKLVGKGLIKTHVKGRNKRYIYFDIGLLNDLPLKVNYQSSSAIISDNKTTKVENLDSFNNIITKYEIVQCDEQMPGKKNKSLIKENDCQGYDNDNNMVNYDDIKKIDDKSKCFFSNNKSKFTQSLSVGDLFINIKYMCAMNTIIIRYVDKNNLIVKDGQLFTNSLQGWLNRIIGNGVIKLQLLTHSFETFGGGEIVFYTSGVQRLLNSSNNLFMKLIYKALTSYMKKQF